MFASKVGELIRSVSGDDRMAEFVEPLKQVSEALQTATAIVAERGMQDPEEAAAVASNYLNVFGYCALAFVWTHQARAALEGTRLFTRPSSRPRVTS